MKTEGIRQTMLFSRLFSQKVEADFDGGAITSDAGALLLREVDKRIGLTEAMAPCIPDPRNPLLTIHQQRAMLVQRVLGIACGYEDLNDHQTLRGDPCFQVLSDRSADPDRPLASPPTLWRLEDRADPKAIADISSVFVETFIASFKTPPDTIILDFDSTDIPVHGDQERRFFHGYYDAYCFLPLYVFCGDQLLVSYLRTSRIDGAKNSRAVLKLLVKRLRQVWPNVRILVRADSGFCRWKLMKWCDANGVYYLLGLAQNPVLLKNAQPWTLPAEWHFLRTNQKVRLFGTFSYAAETWDRNRRVIVKAEHTGKGTNPRFLVTNLPGDAHELYDDLYCARGDMENRIKEQQLDLFATRTSSHYFLHNQLRLLLAGAAYILTETLRRVGLKGTSLENAQAGTIRTKLFKIGALVKSSVRRVVFHLAGGFPLQALFRQIVDRLTPSPSFVFSSG
jgi:hypothetical protein